MGAGAAIDADREPTETTDLTFPELIAAPAIAAEIDRGEWPDPPAQPPKASSAARSSPPPIPPPRRSQGLATPTVVDRAIGAKATVDHTARAEQMARAIDSTALVDPAAAAILAYELGESFERRNDETRALHAYQHAVELDQTLRPARWAVRRVFHRRALWGELVALVDAELASAPAPERVELLVERATVAGHQGSPDAQLRVTLDEAVRTSPRHHRALLELERVVARLRDVPGLLGVWERLAEAIDQPQRKIAYWLEVARAAAATDYPRARKAVDAAARVATGALVERVGRVALALADDHGTPEQISAAIETVVQVLAVAPAGESGERATARRRELVALLRRRAQLARGSGTLLDAWDDLQEAFVASPDEPVVIVELIELAGELERYDDLPLLLHAWQAAQGAAGLAQMLPFWCAEAHLYADRRARLRTLLAALEITAPGCWLLASTAECEVLANRKPGDRWLSDLAAIYGNAGRAAALGSWLGPWAASRPDPDAAAVLHVQAAELLAYYVATPESQHDARAALARASAVAPAHPAVIEALIELDDTSGRGEAAVARLREVSGDRASADRAIRIAHGHGLLDAVAQLERDLVRQHPRDFMLAWRLESTLTRLGRDGERALLLGRLAQDDPDLARRRTALLAAIDGHVRAGAMGAAIELCRQQLALAPHDALSRDTLIDMLRSQGRWAEIVGERLAEARASAEAAMARRALREAAWVFEVWLDDRARAADVYAEWLARIPDDRTALEGVARCRAALGDHDGEVAARASIADLDRTADARWLYARSLERAARYDDAAEQYRGLIAGEDSMLAVTGAALALGDLAARAGDVAMRVEASDAFAKCSTDPQLGAGLFEQGGWMRTLALADFDQAAEAFAAALELQPAREGALLGVALVAGRQADTARAGQAYADLAAATTMPEVAVALWLRAAAIAAACGDPTAANERVDAARLAGPDHIDALFAVADTGSMQGTEATDPFATADRLLVRAEVLATRGALADDPAARISWQLDRAEALELAGQLSEASQVVEATLRIDLDDRRAWSMLRRIAHGAGDLDTWARASCSVARLSHDPELQLKLLREAAEVFDVGGAASNPDHAVAVYRQILAVEPEAPERERLLDMLRKRGNYRVLVRVLTERVTHLVDSGAAPELLVPLLVERSITLRRLDRRDEAILDLAAVLDHAPNHAEAVRLRAELAQEANDLDAAIALWWRFLAIEPADSPRRAQVEQLLEQALANDDGVAAPPAPKPSRVAREFSIPDEPTNPGWEWSGTETKTSPAEMPRRRGPSIIRRTAPQPVVDAVEADPLVNTVLADLSGLQEQEREIRRTDSHDAFGRNTVLADLSELQEQERREAMGGATTMQVAVVDDAATPIPGGSLPYTATRLAVPGPTTGPLDVTASVLAAAVGASERTSRPSLKLTPPALDLAGLDDEPMDLDSGTIAVRFLEADPLSADDSAVVIMSYDQLQPGASRSTSEDTLLQYERELGLAEDQPATGLRIEAGRLAELLAQPDRARAHYDAALLANPSAVAALRGLRRLAREGGDLAEVTRLVDRELAVAGPRERAALARHRVDLLMAIGEVDLARVAVGEILDGEPMDIAALLAYLELAFRDDRTDELARALELLAEAVTDAELRAALQSARAVLAAHQHDRAGETRWSVEALLSDPGAPATRLVAAREAVVRGDHAVAGAALLELAYHVEGEDPITAAVLAVRAQLWSARAATEPEARETMVAAAQLAARAAPRDPLVARVATETALVAGDAAIALHAFTRWTRCKSNPVERAYAAARAAELDPARLDRLWAQVLELDPGDDYAAARLRSVHLAAKESQLAIELDLQLSRDTGRDVPLLRAAAELVGQGQADTAIDILRRSRQQRPSFAIGEALAEHLGAAGRWSDRARLLGELADDPDLAAGDILRLRSAVAWDKADAGDGDAVTRAAAAQAWERVLVDDPQAPIAQAAILALANRTGDADTIAAALARAAAGERLPWAASSLVLRRARLALRRDPRVAQDLAHDSSALGDPRRTLAVMIAAAQRSDPAEVVTALETRAGWLDARGSGASSEPAMLRLRAAQLALDGGDPARATALLVQVDAAVPGMVGDLLEAALRLGGESPRAGLHADSFLRVLRDADLAGARGDAVAAVALYQGALVLRPGDPLAAAPLVRHALALRDSAPIAALVREQVRAAEEIGDHAGKAIAHELRARADELQGDTAGAQVAYMKASAADPSRIDLVYRLERELVVTGRLRDLLQLRGAELVALERASAARPSRELAAMYVDTATLAVREKRPSAELVKLYRGAIAADPDDRLALFHLEALVRGTVSEELADLQERIARTTDDARHTAAWLTRSGDTLAQLGKHAEAVKRFARAVKVLPEYVPAIEAWSQSALAGELWIEVAKAAIQKASVAGTQPKVVAALRHFAGVALMDKAQTGELAIGAFERALEADPAHVDAFLRLRILLEHKGDLARVADLLRMRLEVEPDRAAQSELHRALAEHCFGAGDHKAALLHYRKILSVDPVDVRAHAAIADLASRTAGWQEAADAVSARIVLETDSRTLGGLHYRLGLLCADHDEPLALRSFQHATTHRPGDAAALGQLADLATRAGEWRTALDACEQLVKADPEPERLAANLRRAAIVFARGFSDLKRAERFFELALENAPTSIECLEQVVAFYKDADKPAALAIQMIRIADRMRARLELDPSDGAAYRMLARALAARGDHGQPARAAAELARLLGFAGDPETRMLGEPPPTDIRLLAGRAIDEQLFAGSLQPEVRQIFRVCADVIGQHVGIDPASHGVNRKDRLKPNHPLVAIVREVATRFGLADVEVYVSARDPYAMVLAPTNPPAVVLGSAIAAGDSRDARFAVGAALKLGQLSLAIPARLSTDELGVVGLALLTLVQSKITSRGVNMDQVGVHVPKLRALVSADLLAEARSHAATLTTFDHVAFARDLKIAGLRAGWLASGSVNPGFAALAGSSVDARSVIADPIARSLVMFALRDDRPLPERPTR